MIKTLPLYEPYGYGAQMVQKRAKNTSKLHCSSHACARSIIFISYPAFKCLQAAEASIRRAKNSSDRHDHIHKAGAERKAHDNNVRYHHTRKTQDLSAGRCYVNRQPCISRTRRLVLCLHTHSPIRTNMVVLHCHRCTQPAFRLNTPQALLIPIICINTSHRKK